MFNGNQVIDADGHVMEPNGLYDTYLDPKFRPDLEDSKREVAARPSKFFFGFFHQLNTGRPLGVPNPDKPLVRTGRNPRAEHPDMRCGSDPRIRIKSHGSRGYRCRGALCDGLFRASVR